MLGWISLAGPLSAAVLFTETTNWKYFKALESPSTPETAWRDRVFDDTSWPSGQAPFFYESGNGYSGNVNLTDMRNGYTGIFMRKTFQVPDPAAIGSLILDVRSDDGSIIWINGVEVGRVNVPGGEIAWNGTSNGSAGEPNVLNVTIDDLNMIVTGDNVVAIHALNASIGGSSDFLISASLESTAPDLLPPTIRSVEPPSGSILSELSSVTVTFSEPVDGLDLSDLRVNGLPPLTLSGADNVWTFDFAPADYGPVVIDWIATHGITDFANNPNPFDHTAPEATFDYEVVDIPPDVSVILPAPGLTVASLTRITVVFTEPVIGIHASDLLINGVPATGISSPDPDQFVFQFAQPPAGAVEVAWAPGHGITDLGGLPFGGGQWSYVIDPDAVSSGVIINEFMADNESSLQDEDGEYSDWIELYNAGLLGVNLGGWYLTDTTNDLTQWAIPNVDLAPGEYLILFASGKDRTDPFSELHTNFRLAGGGEYLALVGPDGVTIESEFEFPDQDDDGSFGIVRETVSLVAEGAIGRYLVPSGSIGEDWTGGVAFDDSSWAVGQAALGFDHGLGAYFPLIFTDVNAVMFGISESIYLRIPFTVPDGLEIESVQLKMRYDDGYKAYLNGAEVASRNAPASSGWNSSASAPHLDSAAVVPEITLLANGLASLRQGTNYLAVHGLNFVPYDADPDFLLIPELEVVSRVKTFLASPTPGGPNGSGAILQTVSFSPVRGFYSNAFSVSLSTEVAGALIRYTTNFAEPDETSPLYAGAIPVSRSTVIRAAVFKPGFQPSPMSTHSYVFHSDVLTQPAAPPGWPDTWGSKTAEYEMRPGVVNDYTQSEFTGFLRSMPSIMISSTMENLFDDATGIYDHPTSRGASWERSASVEWIHPDGTSGFGENCGLRIQGGLGGGGRSYEKKSWRFLFKSAYGPSKLRFPVFPWDPDATESFDQLILRAGGNDRQDFTRDEYARRCQIAMDDVGSHGIHVHVYLNGLYWGMYNLVERPAGDFASSYYGGRKEDYDALAHNSGNVIDGDNQAWNAMVNFGRGGLASRERYMQIQGMNPDGTLNPAYPHYVDVDQYINYMLANIYLGMGDWPGHNWYAARRRDPGSDGYKFFVWDGEGAFQSGNRTGVNNGAGETYDDLRANPEFNLRFADIAHWQMFNDGPLVPANAQAMFSELSRTTEPGVPPENARWGHISLSSWRSRRDSKMSYLQSRRDTVVGYLRGAGLYPAIDAPVFSQHGGEVAGVLPLFMTAEPGMTIFYTVDGTDPREPWTDNALGSLYAGGVAVGHNMVVKARARDAFNNWSAMTEALFVIQGLSPLRISEVMYHPGPPTASEIAAGFTTGDFEFVELENTGIQTAGLAGLRLAGGIDFEFREGSIHRIEPGERVLVVRNLAAFQARYTNGMDHKIAGEFGGALDDDGDKVSLKGPSGDTIWSFDYNDSRGWPIAADGAGHSLVPLQFGTQPDGALDYGGNWRASAFINGSPGASDPAPVADVVVNEVIAHTDVDAPPYDSNDGIELFNLTASDISLDDWYLSDEAANLRKWAIPATNIIVADGFIYFDEMTGFHNPITQGFGLNKAGERVYVSHLPGTAQDRVADAVRFKGQENGRSLGRHPDGNICLYAMLPTPGMPNNAPGLDVVISEIMFDPGLNAQFPTNNTRDEYIAICNLTGVPVDLWNANGSWRIDGPDFVFPPNTTIPAGGSLLIVPFDPATDPASLAAFNANYLLDGSIPVMGPFDGNLNNGGERIALERPQAPDFPDLEGSWVIVDEVVYADQSPWPSGANKTGRSIVRINPRLCGNIPFNWRLSPNPAVPGTHCQLPASPVLAVFPQTFELTTYENVNIPSQTVIVRNVGLGLMDVTVSDNAAWLEVEPISGNVGTGFSLPLSLSYNVTTLPVGTHQATVNIASNLAYDSETVSIILRVIARDKTRPTVTGVETRGNPHQLTVTFSKPLERGMSSGGAENVSNYQLNNGITVAGASLNPDGTIVTLQTSTMTTNAAYVLTINNVQDRAIIPNPILPGTQAIFTHIYTSPVAHAGAGAVVGVSSNVVLNGSASIDADGGPQPLSFSWEQLHGPATDITNPNQPLGAAVLPSRGTYIFELTVSDGVTTDTDTVVYLVSETVTLMEAGHVWRYLDTGVDLGTAWRAVGFDDSAWQSGPAQLGYGDGDEDTVVGFGPDSGNKFRTTYFRSDFVATNASEIGSFTFHILRDDGAVVYLNGNEVLRSNMRAGAVEYQTTAESGVGGGAEDTFYPFTVLADDLVEGTNVLAVEIHQWSNTSSDISFDLSIDAEVAEIDEDEDDLPDYWELLKFGQTVHNGTDDLDGDGLDHYGEYVAGTDPLDPDSNFTLRITYGPGQAFISYDTIAMEPFVLSPTTRYYTLEFATDDSLASWKPVPGHMNQVGDGSRRTHATILDGTVKFFRLQVWVE